MIDFNGVLKVSMAMKTSFATQTNLCRGHTERNLLGRLSGHAAIDLRGFYLSQLGGGVIPEAIAHEVERAAVLLADSER